MLKVPELSEALRVRVNPSVRGLELSYAVHVRVNPSIAAQSCLELYMIEFVLLLEVQNSRKLLTLKLISLL